ncbi:hypothetical protein E2542_SST00959 [Spatholobus suberectus]|nr:hypothetical protein E2542_SST00959 [Spatholobus suberectus]
MEGVGARLGRSSTRYGPATVFTGPVRKWKKKWVHVSPSSASSNSNTNHNHNHNHNHASHLLLYKWTPITQSHNTTNNNANANGNANDAPPEPPEEPPRRKFKYVPVALLEEQRNEAVENEGAEKVDDESKPIDADSGAAEPTRKNETLDEKPDINDVPMEESQVNLCMSLCLLHVSPHFLPYLQSKYCPGSNNCSPQSTPCPHKLMKGNYFCD